MGTGIRGASGAGAEGEQAASSSIHADDRFTASSHPSRRYAAAPAFLRREDRTINRRLPSRTIVVDQT
jgi:hypothetical protein